jgi:hypothetical protein
VFAGTVFSGQPLVEYPEAFFAPSPKAEHLKPARQFRSLPPGSLLLRDDQFAIVALTAPMFSTAYAADTGDLVETHSFEIMFSSWEVLVPGPSGEAIVLFDVNVAASGQ